jgi:hypothetical protein
MAPTVWIELVAGNLDLPLAAAFVLAYQRWPAIWATILLTKVTPGIGLLWHLVRLEWRPLAIAGLTTGVVVALSLPFTWDAWMQWPSVLTGGNVAVADTQTFLPFWARVAIAAGIVIFAARSDRLWLVPIAVATSFPIPNEAHWTIALASIRLWRHS